MAFQNPVLLEWRTKFLDNVMLPLEIVREQTDQSPKARTARAKLLALVGLERFRVKTPVRTVGPRMKATRVPVRCADPPARRCSILE